MLQHQTKQILKRYLQPQTPVREYELITLLRQNLPEFPQNSLSDHLTLFHCHFLIRNSLYEIRNEWRGERAAELYISALYIEKLEWVSAQPGLERYDTLADFYLDLSNLEHITSEEVSLLINGFWDKYQASKAKAHLCGILALESDVSDQALIHAWRKASLRLHPDKGGDIERFKQVQSAYDDWRRSQA